MNFREMFVHDGRSAWVVDVEKYLTKQTTKTMIITAITTIINYSWRWEEIRPRPRMERKFHSCGVIRREMLTVQKNPFQKPKSGAIF